MCKRRASGFRLDATRRLAWTLLLCHASAVAGDRRSRWRQRWSHLTDERTSDGSSTRSRRYATTSAVPSRRSVPAHAGDLMEQAKQSLRERRWTPPATWRSRDGDGQRRGARTREVRSTRVTACRLIPTPRAPSPRDRRRLVGWRRRRCGIGGGCSAAVGRAFDRSSRRGEGARLADRRWRGPADRRGDGRRVRDLAQPRLVVGRTPYNIRAPHRGAPDPVP